MFLLIDGNNLAWAGFYPLERAMKPDSQERRDRVALLGLAGGVLGTIARAGTAPGTAETPRLTRVAVAFDDGRPLRRRSVYPPYQTGRERDPKFMENEPTILRAIDAFTEIAESLPIEIVRGTNTEADDLIAGLVQATPGVQKRIVSTDRDFLQLISDETSVYSPVKKLIINSENFIDAVTPSGARTMCPRERFLDYRALVGDASDDLPGVPGVGALTAIGLLSAAPLDSYFRDPGSIVAVLGRRSPRLVAAFQDGTARAIVERNRQLMDLRLPAPSWAQLDKLTRRGRWDRERFAAWLAEQRLSSLDQPALLERMEELAAG